MRQSEARLRIPVFLLLFVAASLAGSLLQPPAEIVAHARSVSHFLLIVALFCIGMEIRRTTIASLNGRAIWMSISLWLMVLPLTLLAALSL